MWDNVKELRWNELRQRELEGKLITAEQEELNRFYEELDNEEHIALQPALARKLDVVYRFDKSKTYTIYSNKSSVTWRNAE